MFDFERTIFVSFKAIVICYNSVTMKGESKIWKGEIVMKDANQYLSLIFGTNLKHYMKLLMWKTQAEFTYAFGAEERTVGRWCNNGIDKLSLIQQIADFLDIDIMKLLLGEEE